MCCGISNSGMRHFLNNTESGFDIVYVDMYPFLYFGRCILKLNSIKAKNIPTIVESLDRLFTLFANRIDKYLDVCFFAESVSCKCRYSGTPSCPPHTHLDFS